MRRSVAALSGVMLAALLVAAPVTASADEPVVRSDGDTLTYVDPALEGEATTTVEGTLRQVVVEPAGPTAAPGHDHEHDGEGRVEQVVVTDDGTTLPVDLDLGPAAATSDVPVSAELVEGAPLDRALDGRATAPVQVAAASIETQQASAVAAPSAHRAYVAVVTNSGDGSLADKSTLDARVDAGLSWWTTESSGAITSFTRPVEQRRYASARADRCGTGGGSGTTNLWTEAAQQFPGVSFSAPGNHLVVIVEGSCGDIGPGIGTLGSSIDSGGQTTMVEDAEIFTSTLVHELGHNVGLQHANRGVAGSTAASAEYWNLYSPMGLAVTSASVFGPPALDSVYRAQLGLLERLDPDEEAVVTAGSSATIVLGARGAATGTRAVRVTDGGTTYWVDLRDGSGRDVPSFYARSASAINGYRYPDGVTITRIETGSPAGTRLLAPTSSVSSWATGQTFTAGSVSVRVDAVGSGTATVTVSNGAAAPAPVDAATPVVSGTPQVDRPLTVDPGAWTSGTAFAYQWLAAGTPVTGATGTAFTPGPSHVGQRISVRVTGSKEGRASVTRTSAESAVVAAGDLTTAAPTVSGAVRVGNQLTAQPGAWTTGTTFTYEWSVDGTPVATGATFTPAPAHLGGAVRVAATGSRAGYTTASRTSGSETVAAGVLTARTPTLSGTPKVGVRLTAVPGTWTSGTTFTYQWSAGGVDVAGATGASFVPAAAQRGRRITVRVTGTLQGYEPATRPSAASAAVAYGTLRSTAPRISGTVKVGRRLSVVRGTWTAGTAFTYRWFANGKAISGATRSTYVPTKGVKGKRLTVRVTGRKTGYTTVNRVSLRTAAVR